MDDGGRCLLDVIDDPILLESFLDEDPAASANAQAHANTLGKNNLTSTDISLANNQLFLSSIGQSRSVLDNSIQNSTSVINTNSISFNGEIKHNKFSVISTPHNAPIKSPARPSSQPIPVSQSNAPSPSLFNSPSPAIATSVLSPAVPSPSQSATVTSLPASQSPNLIQQVPPGSAPLQITTQAANSTQQPYVQILTPVAQPRAQTIIRPKQLQILPKPPGNSNQFNNSPSTKSTPIARAMPMNAVTQGTQPAPQYVISQPANTIIPHQAPTQGGMILINTQNGPVLIPTNGMGMVPGLQLAVRQPAPQHAQATHINQNQILAPLQVAGQHAIVGQHKAVAGNQQTIVIPANNATGAFQNNNIILNNNAIPAASAPSSQSTAARSNVVLAPRIVNGPNQGVHIQPMQSPQCQFTVALQPNQLMVPAQNYIRPAQQSSVPIIPNPQQRTVQAVPEKQKKAPGLDLAELLKEHGIAPEDEANSKAVSESQQEPVKEEKPQQQPVVLSLSQDGSVQLQNNTTQSETKVIASSISSSVPSLQSSAAFTQNHSVLLERLNSAPVNGINQPPPLIPINIQQIPASVQLPVSSSSPAIASQITLVSNSQNASNISSSVESANALSSSFVTPVTSSLSSQGSQSMHLSISSQALMQRMQAQIAQLEAEKVLTPQQKEVLQQLKNAQQKILNTTKSFVAPKVEESVQLSASPNQNFNPGQAIQANPQIKVSQSQNVHLNNLLNGPSNNQNSTPVIQTVIQPQMVINSSVATALPLNSIDSTTTTTSIPTSNVKIGQQFISLATQQKQTINNYQSQHRNASPDQQKLFIQNPLVLKLQQPQQQTTASIGASLNSPVTAKTLYPIKPAPKVKSPTVITSPNASKVDQKKGIKRPSVPKAALIQQELAKHQDKVITPETKIPFRSRQDAVDRLLPYHIFNSHGRTPKELGEADRLFEVISKGLMGRMRCMLNKYQHLLLKQSMKEVSTVELVMLNRMFIEDETLQLKTDKKTVSEGQVLDLPPYPESWLEDSSSKEKVPSHPSADELEMASDEAIEFAGDKNDERCPSDSENDPSELAALNDSVDDKYKRSIDEMSNAPYENELELYNSPDHPSFNHPSSINFQDDENHSSSEYLNYEPSYPKRRKCNDFSEWTSDCDPPLPEEWNNKPSKESDKTIIDNTSTLSPSSSQSNTDIMNHSFDSNDSFGTRDVSGRSIQDHELNVQVESAINSILDIEPSPTYQKSSPEYCSSPAAEYSGPYDDEASMDADYSHAPDDEGDHDASTENRNDDLDEAIRSILI